MLAVGLIFVIFVLPFRFAKTDRGAEKWECDGSFDSVVSRKKSDQPCGRNQEEDESPSRMGRAKRSLRRGRLPDS